MRHERQVELLQRVAQAGPQLTGLFGDESVVNPAQVYTDPERFALERRVLFRQGPVLMGLSCECAEPGSYLTGSFDGVPVAVIRQADGTLRAVVNACRHRGAPVLDGRGGPVHRLVCPYHAWTYELDGTLHNRPRSDGAFDDLTLSCNLHRLAVAEQYGLIYVRPDSDEAIDVDAALSGAQDDLESFALDGYVPIETRTATWKMNWKLLFDTFTEAYHIRALHSTTLAPTFWSGSTIFEPFGRNQLNIGLRKDILDELAKPQDEWSIIPYGTMQYFLMPNALLVHQLDHLELWRLTPVDVRTTEVDTTLFAPERPATEKAHRYWTKNLDLLLDVTGREDFPLMERIQATLDSGALPEVVYGRIEPSLVHLHRSIDAALR